MGNAAIAWQNLADAGILSASSQVLLMPVSLLQDPHVSRRWRSSVNSASFVCDLKSAQSIDSIGVFGGTESVAATARVRVSSTDSLGLAGDLADSGTLASVSTYFDANYGSIVYLLPSPVSGRYVRIDLSDPSASYVEAGRLFVGLRTQFTYNFTPAAQRAWVDRSVRSKTRGGQTQIWIDNAYRTLDLPFDFVTSAQRYGIVETIDRVVGQRADVLVIMDTDSTDLPRDSVWGMISNMTPVSMSALIDIFGKQFQIEERL